LSEKQHRLISNIGGAVLAAVVVGAVFYTFGYSGEQRGRDFLFLNGLSVTFLTSTISLPFVVAGVGLGIVNLASSLSHQSETGFQD